MGGNIYAAVYVKVTEIQLCRVFGCDTASTVLWI